MGNIKDAVDLGLELLQFWTKFKGRRVRVWLSNPTLPVCSESHLQDCYLQSLRLAEAAGKVQSPIETVPELLRLGSVQEASLFEGRISEVVRHPPGLLFSEIHYWMKADGGRVARVRSTDEETFLPFTQLLRIDFLGRLAHVEELRDSELTER